MGFGSVLDIGGRFYEYNNSENPDEIAIASDWLMVGQDIRDALDKAATEARNASTADHEQKQAA